MHRLGYLDHLAVYLEHKCQQIYLNANLCLSKVKMKELIYQHCKGRSHPAGPSDNNFSCCSFFSIFCLSLLSSQLSVGWYSSVSLYSCSCGKKAARPLILAVLRSSGAWSEGGTHRKGGRGAKRARRFGGSLSVILNYRVVIQQMNGKLKELKSMESWMWFAKGEKCFVSQVKLKAGN